MGSEARHVAAAFRPTRRMLDSTQQDVTGCSGAQWVVVTSGG